MARPVKPMTRRRLENVARRHVDRWPTTRAHLRRVLLRRVDKALEAHPGDRDEAVAWVESVLDQLEAAGALNDERFAVARAASLHDRGVSARRIASLLGGKGVPGALAADAVSALGPEPDQRAAASLVRRRRLGPFRDDPAAWRDRDLARLARAGFAYGVAKAVLDLDRAGVEALELGLTDP